MIALPDAFLRHKTLHRMRIKIPSKKGDVLYFMSLREQLSRCDGIEKIEVNPTTGSALFVHTTDETLIGKHGMENNLFSLKKLDTDTANLHQKISETFKDFNDQIRSFTGGGLDIGTITFLALAGAGIYQISRGNFIAPAWYTAFWYALNIFIKSKPDRDGE